MNNMEVYDKGRKVPPEALKKISGGRLNNMSDINPMWRIKTLTELFGVCGFGWKYVITSQRLVPGAKDEIAAFVDIELFVKMNDVWSDAIPGIGGSSFVSQESKGMYNSDECFKMALTDAIGISCKALGIGADVWFERDVTKYTQPDTAPGERPVEITNMSSISEKQVKRLYAIASAANINVGDVLKVIVKEYKKTKVEDLSRDEYDAVCERLQAKK